MGQKKYICVMYSDVWSRNAFCEFIGYGGPRVQTLQKPFFILISFVV